jgi:transposase-like protein
MNIKTPKETIVEDVDKPFCCTHCGNENYIKYGKKNGKQVYMCKSCNRRFVDNLFFERIKCSPKVICACLDLYFKVISFRKISDHLKQFYNLDVHFTTIYYWINRYIKIMDNYVSQFKPNLGNIWQTDEMMISIDGDWFYLWNVLDTRTRFHLASVISKERKIIDARRVFQQAKKRGHGQRPEFIITDGLHSYNKAINKEFHTRTKDTKHIGNVGINRRKNKQLCWDNNKVERLHGTIRERNKTQRGLEKENSAFINGHNIYYNFIRNHTALDDVTPAEKSGIDLKLGKKKWEKLLMKSIENRIRNEVDNN